MELFTRDKVKMDLDGLFDSTTSFLSKYVVPLPLDIYLFLGFFVVYTQKMIVSRWLNLGGWLLSGLLAIYPITDEQRQSLNEPEKYVPERKRRKADQEEPLFRIGLVSQFLPQTYNFQSFNTLINLNTTAFLMFCLVTPLSLLVPQVCSSYGIPVALGVVAILSVKPLIEVLYNVYSFETNELKLTLICGLFSLVISYFLLGNFGVTILDLEVQKGFNETITFLNETLSRKGIIPTGIITESVSLYFYFRILLSCILAFFGGLCYISSHRRVMTHTAIVNDPTINLWISLFSFCFPHIILLAWIRPFNTYLFEVMAITPSQYKWWWTHVIRPSLPALWVITQLHLLHVHVQGYLFSSFPLLKFIYNAKSLKVKGDFLQLQIKQILLCVSVVAIEMVALCLAVMWLSWVGGWMTSFLVVVVMVMRGGIEVVMWAETLLPDLEEKLMWMISRSPHKKDKKEKKGNKKK